MCLGGGTNGNSEQGLSIQLPNEMALNGRYQSGLAVCLQACYKSLNHRRTLLEIPAVCMQGCF